MRLGVGDEEDPDVDTGPACELELASMEITVHVRRGTVNTQTKLIREKGEKDRWLTGRSWAWLERRGVAAGGEFWWQAMSKTTMIQRLEGIPACGTHRGEQVRHCRAIRGLG
jgi:hypothetical protein